MENDRVAGFEKLFRLRPQLWEPLTTGWESCTLGASPSAVDGSINTGHRHSLSTSADTKKKKEKLDKIYCDEETVNTLIERYAEDYAMLARIGMNYSRPICPNK